MIDQLKQDIQSAPTVEQARSIAHTWYKAKIDQCITQKQSNDTRRAEILSEIEVLRSELEALKDPIEMDYEEMIRIELSKKIMGSDFSNETKRYKA